MAKTNDRATALDMEIRSRVVIDKHRLDVCLAEQPTLFLEASDQVTAARSKLDYCREALKVVDARLSVEFRSTGEKTTERGIESQILLDRLHTAAFTAVMDAESEYNSWMVLKDTIHQRGYVLKDLAGLYVAGYFQNATASGGGTAIVREAINDDRRQQIAEVRGRRRLE